MGELSWLLLRARNRKLLRRLKRERDVVGLMTALDNLERFSRLDAADILGELKAGDALPALIRQLKDDGFLMRVSAARALGRIGDASAVPVLIGKLRDPHYVVRATVIAALGEIGDPRAVPPLKPFLTDSNSWLRGRAVYALSLIRDADAQKMAHEQFLREPRRQRRLIEKALRRHESAT